MPVKEREPFEFSFQHNGQNYHFQDYYITQNGFRICYCDLTATEYHGNKLVTLLCCKVALDAYYAGIEDGKAEHKQEVSATLKDLLGL